MTALWLCLLASFATSQDQSIHLARTYQPGSTISYRMTGLNEDAHGKRQYSARADSVVVQTPSGAFIEQISWSDLVWNGKPVDLPEASKTFREELSLDPKANPRFPDLSRVSPMLIGPITDLLTFYVDLTLPIRVSGLKHRGDHFQIPYGRPSSWADGSYVTLGEDSIDFDVTLAKVDRRRHRAVVVIRHVPPAKPAIKLPADWMKEPVKDTPNNWVEISHRQNGKYAAAVGKETFEVSITVDLTTGSILSGTLENIVDVIERDCEDANLSNPGPAAHYRIHRHIELR